MDFARTVRHIMLDKDMSQTDIAAKQGITKQAINQWLSRKDYRINGDIVPIADLLGYDVQLTLIDRQTGQRIDCQ